MKLRDIPSVWSLSVDETLSRLSTDMENGLSEEEAENRLKLYGKK